MMVMFSQVKDIYESNPNINEIYFIDFLNQSKIKSLKEVIALRKNRYNVSINVYPSNRKEYNLVNCIIGAKMKIATRYNHYSLSNFDWLNNSLTQEVPGRHNVLQNFDLVRIISPGIIENELGVLEIHSRDDENKFTEKYLTDNNLKDKFLIGFHAGSATFKRHINKRWSAEKFAELSKRLNDKFNARIILFGTERDVNKNIFTKSDGSAIIFESNNIQQSIALMKKCTLFVSNDSALMHVASALQIPTVAIFGYTNYKELSPWKSKHIIVRKDLECSPCFFNSPMPVRCIYSGEDEFRCMKTITVDEVFNACEKLIEEIPGDVKSRNHFE